MQLTQFFGVIIKKAGVKLLYKGKVWSIYNLIWLHIVCMNDFY